MMHSKKIQKKKHDRKKVGDLNVDLKTSAA